MPVRLYQFATSPFCRKVRKILDYKGIEYDTVEVDYINRGPLLEASGQMRVPALSFEDGATVVDSEQIVLRLEEICAEPTIFPPEWGGIHLGLARYFDTVVEDALFRAAIPDEAAYYEAISPQHAAMWRLMRERKYGLGFCERMAEEHERRLAEAIALIEPLDSSLERRAFLTGRIGYADFALYGQLGYLALSGDLKIPAKLANLRAFYDRLNRLTANVDDDRVIAADQLETSVRPKESG